VKCDILVTNVPVNLLKKHSPTFIDAVVFVSGHTRRMCLISGFVVSEIGIPIQLRKAPFARKQPKLRIRDIPHEIKWLEAKNLL
jgi:hypothetical protein